MSALPDLQLFVRPGIAEFVWGHPAPELLPVAPLAAAAAAALSRHGSSALAYGAEQGPGRLIMAVRARLERREGLAPPVEQLMITGGNSHALDMLCAQLSRPGDVVLVEAPTYHLALRIFRDRGLRIVAVPGDAGGMDIDGAADALARVRAGGERVAFLYVVPTFGNPTGLSLVPERRAALAALAADQGLQVIEDDAYGELWYDEPPAAAIASYLPGGPVARLGSYAKVLAPGLRLGWMLASPQLIGRCTGSGVLDSGGGLNPFTAHVVASLIEAGDLDAHLARVRAAWRERRDALHQALARHMPAGCSWDLPGGGFFIWVRLPPTIDAAALVPAAEAAGVSYLPGERFFAAGGGRSCLRLSFSLLAPAEIDEGVRRLGAALRASLGAG